MSIPATSPLLAAAPSPRRRLTTRALEGASILATLLAVAVLGIVVFSVMARGVGALNLDLITKDPAPFGFPGGGIAPAIVGTAVLIGLAALMAVPVGLLIGVYTSEFARPSLATAVRFALDILNGVPTVVTGIFIFGLLVVGHEQSGWAGAIALAIIMLPIVGRSAHEVLALVPGGLKEASYALGVTRWKTVLRIVIPSAAAGLITGALLGVARVAGETAPLLFTSSIAANNVSTAPGQALNSIPVTIFTLSESPSPSDHAKAWAAAFLLILFVLVLNFAARALYDRTQSRLRRR